MLRGVATLFLLPLASCALSPLTTMLRPAKRPRSTATTSAEGPTIPLAALLSTCVDAATRGCSEIRRVQAQRVVEGTFSGRCGRDLNTTTVP